LVRYRASRIKRAESRMRASVPHRADALLGTSSLTRRLIECNRLLTRLGWGSTNYVVALTTEPFHKLATGRSEI
jgi:hypothetical protein